MSEETHISVAGHLRRIRIEVVPHESQRYDTVGDWYIEKGPLRSGDSDTLVIRVSKLDDWNQELLIAVHELVEAALCANSGVSQEDVDDFDMRGPGVSMVEPGEASEAPYHHQHKAADRIERALAADLGVNWEEYDKALQELGFEA